MTYTTSRKDEGVRLGLVLVVVALVSGLVLLGQSSNRVSRAAISERPDASASHLELGAYVRSGNNDFEQNAGMLNKKRIVTAYPRKIERPLRAAPPLDPQAFANYYSNERSNGQTLPARYRGRF